MIKTNIPKETIIIIEIEIGMIKSTTLKEIKIGKEAQAKPNVRTQSLNQNQNQLQGQDQDPNQRIQQDDIKINIRIGKINMKMIIKSAVEVAQKTEENIKSLILVLSQNLSATIKTKKKIK